MGERWIPKQGTAYAKSLRQKRAGLFQGHRIIQQSWGALFKKEIWRHGLTNEGFPNCDKKFGLSLKTQESHCTEGDTVRFVIWKSHSGCCEHYVCQVGS